MYSRKIILLILSFYLFANSLTAQPFDSDNFPEIEGFVKSETLRTYSADNLFDYINGAADLYLKYEFQKLYLMIYESGNKSLIIEIYNHTDPENAFGIYSQERPLDGEYIQIGAQGYYEKGVFNFLKETNYIKITGYNLGASDSMILFSAARKLDTIITGDSKLPEVLKIFPETGKIVNSEQFINKNFLGYSFLTKAYTAEYSINEEFFKVFYLSSKDETEAKAILTKYNKMLKDEEQIAEEGYLTLNDPYHGNMFLLLESKNIFGVINCGDEKLAGEYLQKMSDNNTPH